MEKIVNIKGVDYIVSDDGKIFSTKNIGRGKYHQELNADKERLSQESDLNVYFSTYDLEYKNEPSYGADDAHYDSVSEIILGNRFGEYVAKFLDRD